MSPRLVATCHAAVHHLALPTPLCLACSGCSTCPASSPSSGRRLHVIFWKFLTMGVAMGVYRDIYPPNQSTLYFLCGCFVSLTQDKFDIVHFVPTQIKFLATPLFLTSGVLVFCRPGRCPEIPEILKFVLKCPEIGVRS